MIEKVLIIGLVILLALLGYAAVRAQDVEPAYEPLRVAVIVDHYDCAEPNPEWGNCTPLEGSSVQVSDSLVMKAATTNYLGTATLFFEPVTLPSTLEVVVDGREKQVVQVVEGDWHYHVHFYDNNQLVTEPFALFISWLERPAE